MELIRITWDKFLRALRKIEHVVKNELGEVIAGILAGLGCWGGVEIKILWVKKDLRQSDIGTKLSLDN